MKRTLFLIICLTSLSAKANVNGEKPNDFILQCPSKYVINREESNFLYKYSSENEWLIIWGGVSKDGYYSRFFEWINLLDASPFTLTFGKAYPNITIYRESLKIKSPWNNGEVQCEFVTEQFYDEALEVMKEKEKKAEEKKQRLAEEQQKKNKI